MTLENAVVQVGRRRCARASVRVQQVYRSCLSQSNESGSETALRTSSETTSRACTSMVMSAQRTARASFGSSPRTIFASSFRVCTQYDHCTLPGQVDRYSNRRH